VVLLAIFQQCSIAYVSILKQFESPLIEIQLMNIQELKVSLYYKFVYYKFFNEINFHTSIIKHYCESMKEGKNE